MRTNSHCWISDTDRKRYPPRISRSIRLWFRRKKHTRVCFFRMLELTAMLQLTTIIFLIAFSMFAVIHIIALTLSLYWHFVWFDIPMHAFGGIIIGLGFFTLRDLKLFPNTWLRLPRMFVLTLLIVIAWECFEFFAGIPVDSHFVVDTALDIAMGLTGSIIGFYIGKSLRNLR